MDEAGRTDGGTGGRQPPGGTGGRQPPGGTGGTQPSGGPGSATLDPVGPGLVGSVLHQNAVWVRALLILVVTVAFLIGAQMAGAIGALVAIPVAAIITSFVFYYFDRNRAERGWSAVEATTALGAGLAPEPKLEVPS
jgi:uncharacterized membrane protein